MNKICQVLCVLAVILITSACQTTSRIPEDAWKTTSIDELMGGKQVAEFTGTDISTNLFANYFLDFDKGKFTRQRRTRPSYTWNARKEAGRFCSHDPAEPWGSGTEKFEEKMWFCGSVFKARTKEGVERFRVMIGEPGKLKPWIADAERKS